MGIYVVRSSSIFFAHSLASSLCAAGSSFYMIKPENPMVPSTSFLVFTSGIGAWFPLEDEMGEAESLDRTVFGSPSNKSDFHKVQSVLKVISL